MSISPNEKSSSNFNLFNLKKLDLLSDNNINFTSEVSKKTNLGGIFTILLLVAFVILNYKTTLNFFQRINSDISLKADTYDYFPKANMTTDFLPFAFHLKPSRSFQPVSITQIIYFRAFSLEFSVENGFNSVDLEVKLCKDIKIEYKSTLVSDWTDIYYCVDWKNFTFEGNRNDEANLNSIFSLTFLLCGEGGINPQTNEECASKEQSDRYDLNDVEIEFLLPNYNLDKNNKTNNGLEKILEPHSILLDWNFKKIYQIFFSTATIVTDDGIIFPDLYNKKTSYYVDSVLYDVLSRNYYGEFVTFYLSYSKNYKEYVRTFMKIDQLLGQFGGVFQIILTISSFIANYFSETYFYLSMINKVGKWQYLNYSQLRREGIKKKSIEKLKIKNINSINSGSPGEYNKNNANAKAEALSSSFNKNKDDVKDDLKIESILNKNLSKVEKNNNTDKKLVLKNNRLNLSQHYNRHELIDCKSKKSIDIDYENINLKKTFTNKEKETPKYHESCSINNPSPNENENSSSNISNHEYEECHFHSKVNLKIKNIINQIVRKEKAKESNLNDASTESNTICLIIYKILGCFGINQEVRLSNYKIAKKLVESSLDIKSYFKCCLTQEVIKNVLIENSQIMEFENCIS